MNTTHAVAAELAVVPERPATAPPDAATAAAAPARFRLLPWLQRNRQDLALPLMFIAAVVVFSLQAPGFLSADNLTNMARQSVYLLIVALGQLIVLVGGGLDLSVGMVVSLTSVASATVMAAVYAAAPDAPWLAVAAGAATGLVIGCAVGLVNGLGTTLLKIPPFMMTLGMSSVLFGITLLVSGGVPIYGLPPVLGEVFGFGEFLGVPVPAIVAVLLVGATYLLLEWSRFGRHLYATGGNPRAAELSGVRTRRVLITCLHPVRPDGRAHRAAADGAPGHRRGQHRRQPAAGIDRRLRDRRRQPGRRPGAHAEGAAGHPADHDGGQRPEPDAGRRLCPDHGDRRHPHFCHGARPPLTPSTQPDGGTLP